MNTAGTSTLKEPVREPGISATKFPHAFDIFQEANGWFEPFPVGCAAKASDATNARIPAIRRIRVFMKGELMDFAELSADAIPQRNQGRRQRFRLLTAEEMCSQPYSPDMPPQQNFQGTQNDRCNEVGRIRRGALPSHSALASQQSPQGSNTGCDCETCRQWHQGGHKSPADAPCLLVDRIDCCAARVVQQAE